MYVCVEIYRMLVAATFVAGVVRQTATPRVKETRPGRHAAAVVNIAVIRPISNPRHVRTC